VGKTPAFQDVEASLKIMNKEGVTVALLSLLRWWEELKFWI
jgi:hypothetical protein